MKTNKILFLDHDSVICLSTEWGSRFKNKEGFDSLFDRFNDKAIKTLNQIIEETDCEIVVSSDWRFHCTLEQMKELYKIRGIKKSPIDYTRNDLDWKLFKDIHPGNELEMTRCFEIQDWLKEHPEVTHWGWGNNDVVPQAWGHVANMYFYNRQLSLSEITQQYNFLAPRFIVVTPTPTNTKTPTPTPTSTEPFFLIKKVISWSCNIYLMLK